LRLRPLSLVARTGTGDDPSSHVAMTLLSLAVLVASATLLARMSGRNRWLAGAALGLLGQAAIQFPLQTLVFLRRLEATDVAQFITGIALITMAVGRMVGDTRQRFLPRLTLLLASFPLPLAALWLTLGSASGFRGQPGIWLALPATVICLLMAWRQQVTPASNANSLTWRATLVGAATTLALALVVPRAGEALSQHLNEHRLAAGRAAVAALPPVPADAPYPKLYFHRGVNFTAEYPASYGTLASLEMLARLPGEGVNAVALVPYGGTSDRPPRVRLFASAGS